MKVIRSLFLLVGLAAIAVAPLGNSQDVAKHRLGRPLDWSHAHLVASRGGPDGGLSIYADWRTVFRHLEIDQAQAARQAAIQSSHTANRFQRSWAQAAWLLFPVVGLLVFGLVGTKTNKRKWAVYFSSAALLTLGILSGCGRSTDVASAASSPDVKLDWSLNTGGAGGVTSFPAKFSFDITASSCNDVIYFTVPQAGGPLR